MIWLIIGLSAILIVLLVFIILAATKLNHLNNQYENLEQIFIEKKYSQEVFLNSEKSQKIAEINQFYSQEKEKHLLKLAEEIKKSNEELNNYRIKQTELLNKQLSEEKKREILKNSLELQEKLESARKHFEDALNVVKASAEEKEKIINDRLNSLLSMENAARMARIREYEEKNKENFYLINIEQSDIQEIEKLEEIIPLFKNPLPIRKAIFDIYYKTPVNAMINRITEGRRITGIYKITNIKNGMCYIGQSVDIGNRWMQHCKRGCGSDTPTNSRLYPEMLKEGIYNFKFEIIEEVKDELLGVREKYWGEYFGSKIFGYSIKN